VEVFFEVAAEKHWSIPLFGCGNPLSFGSGMPQVSIIAWLFKNKQQPYDLLEVSLVALPLL